MTDNQLKKVVAKTKNRRHSPEYIAQIDYPLNDELFKEAPDSKFIKVRNINSDLRPEIHTKFKRVNEEFEGKIRLDFTLRYAIAATAETDLEYSEAEEPNEVVIEPATNPETKRCRRLLNSVIGVRPQICRVRMAVFPDLEDRICRIDESTMEIIGIESGDYICIESTEGIIRSVKAFTTNERIREKKEEQMEEYGDYYRDCKDDLNLDQLRKTGVDIPKIFIDEETRNDLKIDSRPNKGVCQPVRIYRDPIGVMTKSAYEISIPISLVLLAGVLEPSITGIAEYILLLLALAVLTTGFLIRHRNMLGGVYGFNSSPWDKIKNWF